MGAGYSQGYSLFRSTLPRGERRRDADRLWRTLFVSIHAPARGATRFLASASAASRVSIHAPARGATWRAIRRRQLVDVSIHAPARGATCGHRCKGKASACFDPRSREGSDDPAVEPAPQEHGFDPRSREGSDGGIYTSVVNATMFRSTLPRGERLMRRGIFARLCRCFNPRSREGSDGLAPLCRLTGICFDPRSREGSDVRPGFCHSAA